MPISRTDLNIIMDDLRDVLGSPGLATADRITHQRGKITFDSADYQVAGYLVADGLLLGSAFGVSIFRDAALDDGIYEYYDEAGTLLATNAV